MVDQKNIERLLSVINLAADMERELGLQNLNIVSRAIYYSVAELKTNGGTAQKIRSNPKLSEVSRSSFFRHLNDLCEAGFIIKIKDETGHPRYTIT